MIAILRDIIVTTVTNLKVRREERRVLRSEEFMGKDWQPQTRGGEEC